jgi:hypothetical protein
MQQVYPDQGLVEWLTRMANGNIQVGLYTNALSIDRTVVFASLSEAAWTGYSRVILNSGSWTISEVSHLGIAIGTPAAFNNGSGSPVTAYGYFFLDNTGALLLAVAQFDAAPITIAAADSYVLIPSMGDLSKATTSP